MFIFFPFQSHYPMSLRPLIPPFIRASCIHSIPHQAFTAVRGELQKLIYIPVSMNTSMKYHVRFLDSGLECHSNSAQG